MLPAVVYCPVLTVGVKSGHRQSEQNVLKRPFHSVPTVFFDVSKRDLYIDVKTRSLFFIPFTCYSTHNSVLFDG